jgi:hypothetical protein
MRNRFASETATQRSFRFWNRRAAVTEMKPPPESRCAFKRLLKIF